MIPVFAPWLSENVRRYVLDCVDSGWISSLGQYVGRFERDFATFCEARHAVATSNGTTALHLCLATLGIGPGDEVLVPDLTFVSTANVVRYTGATPVLVDSEPRTWGMDAADARRKLTARTRAIIPVHLYGHPVDMDPFLAMAAEHRLDIVEDAAEAHGARYKGQPGRGARTDRRLLLLREQDHHDRRGRHGRDQRPGARRARGVPAETTPWIPAAGTSIRRSASTTA